MLKGTKHTKESKRKMALSPYVFKKGHTTWLGKKHTEEQKNKISMALKGKLKSKETRKKMSERMINNPNRIFKDTSIELKIESELRKRDINYLKQIPLCNIAIVDFYLPETKTIIQADGDYWHNKQGARERDNLQDRVLISNGFVVYRFWEHEINKSVEKCMDKIYR